MMNKTWYQINHTENLCTPALAVYPDRIMHNIQLMISMIGDVTRLRPHVKTYKNADIIKMQMNAGIQKFKCATIAEAELLAQCKAPDILLAMQPVGPNAKRFFELIKKFPEASFSTLVDNPTTLLALAALAKENNTVCTVWVDINNGMNRTGIIPNKEALALYSQLCTNKYVLPAGLHVYDGHLRNPHPERRKEACDKAFATVLELKKMIEDSGLSHPKIVAGGSPTFPYHCKRSDVEASPGTTLLWDAGYGALFPEMNFLPAAVLLTRILSKPKTGILCFDVGHKSMAPEMPFPRVDFLTLQHGKQIKQSEEHLVVEYDDLSIPKVGELHYAIPKHICPTVAKYDTLIVVKNGVVTDNWRVVARNHKMTI